MGLKTLFQDKTHDISISLTDYFVTFWLPIKYKLSIGFLCLVMVWILHFVLLVNDVHTRSWTPKTKLLISCWRREMSLRQDICLKGSVSTAKSATENEYTIHSVDHWLILGIKLDQYLLEIHALEVTGKNEDACWTATSIDVARFSIWLMSDFAVKLGETDSLQFFHRDARFNSTLKKLFFRKSNHCLSHHYQIQNWTNVLN